MKDQFLLLTYAINIQTILSTQNRITMSVPIVFEILCTSHHASVVRGLCQQQSQSHAECLLQMYKCDETVRVALMTDATSNFETSANFYHTPWFNVAGDGLLHLKNISLQVHICNNFPFRRRSAHYLKHSCHHLRNSSTLDRGIFDYSGSN